MTRDEQIRSHAIVYVAFTDNMLKNAVGQAFTDGANWADSHPSWHKYPENTPPKPANKEYPLDRYIVSDNRSVYEALWDGRGFYTRGSVYSEKVVAWMKMPKLPKFN